VQHKYAKDYGMTPEMRSDPIRATTAIMPTIKRLLDSAKGDWATARLGYMRGAGAMNNVQRTLSGAPIAQAQYDKFRGLQQVFAPSAVGVPRPQQIAPTPEQQAQFMTAQAPGASVGVQPQQDPQMYAMQYPGYTDDDYDVPEEPVEPVPQPPRILTAEAEQYTPPTEYEQMLAHFRDTRQQG
jgi:hypothetical protein